MTNPFWVVKTRMCTTTRYTPDAYTGLWDGLKRLAREEGIRGLYRGMVPAIFGVSHGAIQFMAYEEMKKWRNDIRKEDGVSPKEEQDAKLNNTEYLVMAASSKVLATVTTYPYQVLRSRLQVPRFDNTHATIYSYKSFFVGSINKGYIFGSYGLHSKDLSCRGIHWLL